MSRAETNAPHPRRAVVAVADEDAGRQGGPRPRAPSQTAESCPSPAYRNSNYDLAYSAWAGLNSNFIGPFDDPVEVALTGLVGNTAGDMNDDKAIN